MMFWKGVSWIPQASLSTKLGWYNTSAQWKTFSADIVSLMYSEQSPSSGKSRAGWRRDTRKGTKRGTERERESRRSINRSSWMTMDMVWCAQTRSWANVVWYTSRNACNVLEKNDEWGCSCLQTNANPEWPTQTRRWILPIDVHEHWPRTDTRTGYVIFDVHSSRATYLTKLNIPPWPNQRIGWTSLRSRRETTVCVPCVRQNQDKIGRVQVEIANLFVKCAVIWWCMLTLHGSINGFLSGTVFPRSGMLFADCTCFPLTAACSHESKWLILPNHLLPMTPKAALASGAPWSRDVCTALNPCCPSPRPFLLPCTKRTTNSVSPELIKMTAKSFVRTASGHSVT